MKYLSNDKNYALRHGKVEIVHHADVVVGDRIISLRRTDNFKGNDEDDDYWFEMVAEGHIITNIGTLMPQLQKVFEVRDAEMLDYDLEHIMLSKLEEFNELVDKMESLL